jgi:hypothetical protein
MSHRDQFVSDKLLALFGGNMSAYGQDVPKDGDPAAGGMRVDAPLTSEKILAHLKGTIGIGCYPSWHTDDGVLMAKWGCCDIDTGDWGEAYALATALRAMGIEPHIERSRRKGWHIWIFASRPVTAKAMRRALKVAYAAIELPAKEANPKSEQLREGQVGNYVRLPYKGAYRDGNPERQTFMDRWSSVDDGIPITVDEWINKFDSSDVTPAETIEKWAALYHEQTRNPLPRNMVELTDDQLGGLVATLRGDLRLFIEKGPQADRSSGLVALAFKLRGAGYTAQEMFGLLKLADQRWGNKYSSRPNGDQYIYEIIERAI